MKVRALRNVFVEGVAFEEGGIYETDANVGYLIRTGKLEEVAADAMPGRKKGGKKQPEPDLKPEQEPEPEPESESEPEPEPEPEQEPAPVTE